MKLFLYEFITGGGLWADPAFAPFGEELAAEGRAMVTAIAEDFLRLPQFVVSMMWDTRLPPPSHEGATIHRIDSGVREAERFETLAEQSDFTLLIAPEINGHLAQRRELLDRWNSKTLNPALEFTRIASDKHATCEALNAAAIPCPAGGIVRNDAPPPGIRFPLVLKPRDGAGSQGVRLIQTEEDWNNVAKKNGLRCESFHPGVPASVSVLSGPSGVVILPPCRQRLTEDGAFTYLGGAYPLSESQVARAAALARRVAKTLPGANGYWSIDLILGESEDGSRDAVIEINPRLTTSYIGLRAACQSNLAAALLDLASDASPSLSFASDPLEFDADGTVRQSGSTHRETQLA